MISFDSLSLLINSSIKIKNAKILTFGNPFLEEGIFQSNLISNEKKKELRSIDKVKQIKYLLIDILGAKKLDILDITSVEDADIVFDLNKPISGVLTEKKYDILLDLGTTEHVFNRNIVIENIFKFLKVNGIYVFHLAATGQLDHGFIQYSPSFMYDLCHANKKVLSLLHLGLYHSSLNKGISTLPLYESLDKDHHLVLDKDSKNFNKNIVNLKFLTGTSYQILNYFPTVMLLGAIKKNKDNKIKHNAIQCVYRNINPREFFIESTKNTKNFKSFAKKLFYKFPLPALLKLKLLIKISKFL